MASGLIVGLVGAGLQYGAKLLSRSSGGNDDYEIPTPASLADLQVATVTEGTPIPIVYGRCRVGCTFMWYQPTGIAPYMISMGGGGGKGFGGSSQRRIAGYYYYVSFQNAICLAANKWVGDSVEDGVPFSAEGLPITILNCWNDGESRGSIANFYYVDSELGVMVNMWGAVASFTYTGTETTPARFASVYTVNYISKDSWRVGSYEFAVRSIPGVPYTTYGDSTVGANPADIVYDLLKRAGVRNDQINTASFENAAKWFAAEIGTEIDGHPELMMSKAITSQESIGDIIYSLLEYTDVYLYIHEGVYYLVVGSQSYLGVTGELIDDFSSFDLKPKDVWDMPSEVRATYLEPAEYSEQNLSFYNEHVRKLRGGVSNPITMDLTKFTDALSATWLTTYWGQKQAQMTWTLTCTCSYRASLMSPGEIWRFTNNILGVSGTFQVKAVTINPLKDGTVDIEAESTTISFTESDPRVLTGELPTGAW